jgi:hypothetical protein
MNLLEIQEDLKDQTMDIVMGYANGTNPDVPPYLALAELNRRKRMEQASKTGAPPDGTVKDKLEKELTGQAADLMQAGAAKQAQSNQQLQQGLMAQPQPVPEGTPQPPPPEEEMPEMAQQMPQMAAGGLTSLPTNDMFKFAGGGGVVAFAGGDAVVDEFSAANPEFFNQQLEQNKIKNEERQRLKSQQELVDKIKFLETAAPEVAERLKRERASELPQAAAPAKAQQGIAYDPATATRRSDFPQSQPAPAAAPPGGGIPASMKMPGAPTFTAPDKDAYKNELAAFKQANPGVAGSEFQKLLDKIAKQDEDDRSRFFTQEKSRTRADFWKSLIDAGEATRGQKGIGALLGGFGRSAGASEAAAFDRADAQAKVRREQELGMAKMRAELEAARRAEARGDFEAAFKHKQDAEKIGMDLQQKQFSNQMDIANLQEKMRGNSIQAAGQNRLPQLVQVAEDIQRKNPQMSPNEAMERAASYMASGQYQSSAQRQAKAVADALAEKTKMIDQQLSIIKPGSAEEKTLTTQRNKIIERFMADQRLLTGKSGTQDVNTPSPGFGTFKPVNPT